MPSNLEIKVEIRDFSSIKNALGHINAAYWGIIPQKDIYYGCPGGLLKLRLMKEKNELIYYNRDEVSTERRSDYHILIVPDEAEEFFKLLYKVEVTVEKERHLYLYGNTRIHLDIVKNLGNFLELESVITDSKENAQKEFDFLYETLGLSNYSSIRKSYSDLLKEQNQ